MASKGARVLKKIKHHGTYYHPFCPENNPAGIKHDEVLDAGTHIPDGELSELEAADLVLSGAIETPPKDYRYAKPRADSERDAANLVAYEKAKQAPATGPAVLIPSAQPKPAAPPAK